MQYRNNYLDRSAAPTARVSAEPASSPLLLQQTHFDTLPHAKTHRVGHKPTDTTFAPSSLDGFQPFNPHRALLKAYCKSPYRERPGRNTLFHLEVHCAGALTIQR
jgi:hypothetical protein